MDVIYRQCCGIDVHKETVAVCTLRWQDNGKVEQEKRVYGTTTGQLRELGEWLQSKGVTHIAMEATGVYWEPVWNVLERQSGWSLILVNPEHCKAIRGKKTDLKDGQRIGELLQHGLLSGSFVPPAEIRALRDLTRYRTRIQQSRGTLSNRVQKFLEKGNIKLASVASDVLGVSGRAMLEQLSAGEQDPEKLADLACGRLRGKRDALRAALEGCLLDLHCFLLKQMSEELRQLEAKVYQVEAEITQRMASHEDELRRLETITGVRRVTAWTLLAEIGTNMQQFPSAEHLASWAGVCPGNNESGGKRKTGKTRPGNRWLRRALCEAAWAAAHSKDTYLSVQFKRLAVRRGSKRALLAVAHTILVVAYHLLSRRCEYRDLGGDYFDRLHEGQLTKRLVKRLQDLGHEVVLDPSAS